MTTSSENENKVVLTIPTGFLKGRYGVTGSFTVGVLLFFLPFVTIKCNDVKLASATGMEISTGFELKPGKDWENLGNIFDNPEKNARRNHRNVDSSSEKYRSSTTSEPTESGNVNKLEPNYFLATSLAMGVLGILFSLLPVAKRWWLCLAAGWTGIVGFIISVFAIFDTTRDYRVDAGFIKLSVNFTGWFFLSVIAFITAIVLSHRQWNELRAFDCQKEINEFIAASGYESVPTVTDDRQPD
jgi:hypothetical protein